MAEPTLLFCVGATKAGTSWLYEALRDHEDCHVTPIKELHYFDSFGPKAKAWQVNAITRRLGTLERQITGAAADGETGKAAMLARRLEASRELLAVIDSPRETDAAYLEFLMRDAGGARVVADVTPSYGLQSGKWIKRMLATSPESRVLYLIRDPLARLWSQVRMGVKRDGLTGPQAEREANDRLAAMIARGDQQGEDKRGDYAGIIAKLRRLVPEGRLMICFTEHMFTAEGFAGICRFLGIAPTMPDTARHVHRGIDLRLDDSLRGRATDYLRYQYDWVAEHVGPLPDKWQSNLARV